MADVLKYAKDLFFPNGKSPRGYLDEFEIDLRDFQYEKVSYLTTVEDMYDRSKMRLLRFYLQSKNFEANEEANEESIPPPIRIKKDRKMVCGVAVSDVEPSKVPDIGEEIEISSQDLSSDDDLVSPFSPNMGRNIREQENFTLIYDQHVGPQLEMNTEKESDSEIEFGRKSDVKESLDATIPVHKYQANDSFRSGRPVTSALTTAQPRNLDLPSGVIINVDDAERGADADTSLQLRIHRGQALMEMIQMFQDESTVKASKIEVTMVLPNGKEEQGTGNGVFRDAITEFWCQFKEECCLGNSTKVPLVRHDFQEPEWRVVGNIMLVGYKTFKYFPTFLAQTLIEDSLFGKFNNTTLLENFLQYVTDTEQELFKQALMDFSMVDMKDLVDALQDYDCRTQVSEGNLKQVLLEVAHRILIQEPKYIINSFGKALIGLRKDMSFEIISDIYKNSEPTPRKVLQLLQFPISMKEKESTVSNHLRRFVKELDKELIKDFVRFCTGSNMLSNTNEDNIYIEFADLDGWERRPIGRTCGRILQLPRSYERVSYPVFKKEFRNILSTKIWTMDIV